MMDIKEEILDNILDKITLVGYDQLTKREKEILLKISKDEDFVKINTGNKLLDEKVNEALNEYKIATFRKIKDKFDGNNHIYFILFSNEEQLVIKNFNDKRLDLSDIFGDIAGSFYAFFKQQILNKLGLENAIKFLDAMSDYYDV